MAAACLGVPSELLGQVLQMGSLTCAQVIAIRKAARIVMSAMVVSRFRILWPCEVGAGGAKLAKESISLVDAWRHEVI